MSDKSSRTEDPTPRRKEKARREGQFPVTRHFLGALQFLVFVILLHLWGSKWLEHLMWDTRAILGRAFAKHLSSQEILALLGQLLLRSGAGILLAGVALVTLTLAVQLAVTKMGFSLKKLAPDFKRFNPVSKLQELPRQNIPAFVQALLMLPAFGAAIYFIARDSLLRHSGLPLQGVAVGVSQVGASVMDLLWKCSGVFLVFGVVELAREKFRHSRDLRMTKHEVKEEFKELEGNPQIKARIRRLARDRVRRRMMAQVQTATAVIVNPTHYAVALRYELNSMAAPIVVAKGKNYLAQRIRQRALEHQVPLVENPPLAQALYRSVDVGQEIPAHLYRAVAEVLAYIYRLMNRRQPAS
jgi:flagellar biosynthetic protein FlhB